MREYINIIENALHGSTEDDLSRQTTIHVGGVQRPTQNSEGALIAPTHEEMVAFWRWFGKSKVVDDQGRPLVVFRGDQPGKTEFTGREKKSNYIQGNIFFSTDRGIAKGYTPHRTNSYISSKDMNQSHGLYAAYLKMERPVVVDAKGENWDRIPVSGRLKKALDGWDSIQIDDLAQYVRQNTKSDGLIVRNVWDQFGDGDQLIVFSNQQIKLC